MMQKQRKKIGVRIEGLVQGVGFRWFVLREAERLKLGGWVRNAHDGSVEVRAEGDAEAIDEFERSLRQGPDAARVRRVTHLPETSEPLPAHFEITR